MHNGHAQRNPADSNAHPRGNVHGGAFIDAHQHASSTHQHSYSHGGANGNRAAHRHHPAHRHR